MINCFEEESIHSYLLRRLLCVGEFTTEAVVGIVSQLGVMRANPKILERHLYYFRHSNLSSSDLVAERNVVTPFLDENVTQIGKYVRINRALFHGFTFDEVFSGSTQLRFCVYCLRERIKNDGVAWLEDEWTFNERCKVHNALMHELRDYNCRCRHDSLGIVDRLRSMLTGVCVGCGEDIYALKAASGRDTHKHPDYPNNYWFHDIVYKEYDQWYGLDGKKSENFLSRL